MNAMNAQTHFDLVILGSGSTAFAAALRAQELGKTAVMSEERIPGGTCVNRGCLPSKNLIEAAKLLYDAKNPRYPGISPTNLELDFQALIKQKDDVIAGYRNKKYESLLGTGFYIEQGHAEFVDAHTVQVGEKQLSGENILIATGSRPVLPSIEGLESVPYLTSDLLTSNESMELTECPHSLLIIGGGYIALELGQMFHRFGTEVTILERSQQVLAHGYEPEAGQTIGTIFQEEGIQIITQASVSSVRQETNAVVVTVSMGDSTQEFRAEKLLITTGRRPNTDNINIEKSGVLLGEKGQVQVDEYLKTNVSHIFAAGDVIGSEISSQMATPVGSQDGGIVAHNALSDQNQRSVNHRVIPRAIFTDPQIGIVGMTEKEAIAAGHRCWCRAIPMSLVPRAGAIRDTKGVIKMVADAETDEVLGVTMVGNSAAEIIHEVAMGMRFHAKLYDFIDLIHIYPTMAEALKIAAISRYKDPAKLSCCAE
ncbi:MAG: mercury(II) reductase [Cyanobacteria bacterium QS_7_48_42]|jgi:mercuric reductase|nr:MAG: mercury(II) reductase [Cyanobacteria bacterium QH_7_48_89]PSO65298.1 MAG: mercury(II) reductase [Cyanobacteria bacterium QH_6_48_35]PSO74474.1 MAG: mercury(II) reductase [Cyanobacteria bacterium QS_1_48_34]PSP05662.1 MAG: mercury(II) reductase [Cyanobacteria bacterium QS_7_48_42]PSP29494.1 MAG: mercury(II) reductase [Cyanobacteria bacterium SW_4_48_29]